MSKDKVEQAQKSWDKVSKVQMSQAKEYQGKPSFGPKRPSQTVSVQNGIQAKVVHSRFCFPFKIPDNPTATNLYIYSGILLVNALLVYEEFLNRIICLSTWLTKYMKV